MKEENKYYTPEITEFHVDFEYEILSIYLTGLDSTATEQEAINMSDSIEKYYDVQRPKEAPFHETRWSNNKVRIDTKMIDLDRRIRQNRIRVKCLDKQDIESFGYVLTKEESNMLFFTKIIDVKKRSEIVSFKDGTFNIFLKIYGMLDSEILNYPVRNKSELEFILKRLKIV